MNFSSDMHIDQTLIGDSFLMKTWMIISLTEVLKSKTEREKVSQQDS